MLIPILGQVLEVLKRLGTNADAAAINTTQWAMLKTLNAKQVAVDKSACVPFNVVNNTTFALTNVFQAIRSETGKKGYLDEFAMFLPAVGTIRITVDGSIKYDITNNGVGSIVITRRGNIEGGGTYDQLAYLNPNGATFTLSTLNGIPEVVYGYSGTVASAYAVSMLADSIYYNTSLLIEAKLNTGTGNGLYRLSGGSY